jgi:hypothetical protein
MVNTPENRAWAAEQIKERKAAVSAASSKNKNKKRKSNDNQSESESEEEEQPKSTIAVVKKTKEKRASSKDEKRKKSDDSDSSSDSESDQDEANDSNDKHAVPALLLPTAVHVALWRDFDAIQVLSFSEFNLVFSHVIFMLFCSFALQSHQKLVALPKPADESIHSILTQWKESQFDASQTMAVSIFTTALEHFFEKLLPTQLLYRYERLQVAEFQAAYPQMWLAKVFGVEHLLRLLVKLPDEIKKPDSVLKLRRDHRAKILSSLNTLIQYIAERLPKLSRTYVVAAPDYGTRLEKMLKGENVTLMPPVPRLPSTAVSS